MKKKLFLTVELYVNGMVTFAELENDFYDVFVELEIDFEDKFNDFFSNVCEKMDYTSLKKLNKEDKLYGWIIEKDFVVWLKEELILFSS